MKKLFASPKHLFTLLMAAAVIAIAAGIYLAAALALPMAPVTALLAFAGLLLWVWAWTEFFLLCLRLRKGGSAFSPATGRTLRFIGWCTAGMAAVSLAAALVNGVREAPAFALIELVLLPGVFLAASLVAKLLQGLLTHAMALEAEQEGVV